MYLSQRWAKESKKERAPVKDKDVEDALWNAVDEGLVEEIRADQFSKNLQYKFTHDMVSSMERHCLSKSVFAD